LCHEYGGPQLPLTLPLWYATGDDRNRLTGQDEAHESKDATAAPEDKAREDHGSNERLDRLDVDDRRLVGCHHGHLLPDRHLLTVIENNETELILQEQSKVITEITAKSEQLTVDTTCIVKIYTFKIAQSFLCYLSPPKRLDVWRRSTMRTKPQMEREAR